MLEQKLFLTNQRIAALDRGFGAAFGGSPHRYFSAPGRTELGGNHTDHQRGRVLAAAVDLDMQAAVRLNGTRQIRVLSQGYPMAVVDLADLTPRGSERNGTAALIRGVAEGFQRLGCPVAGFDAYVESSVLPGSGLSSSAAYEVLIGTIIDHLFFDGKAGAVQVAEIGRYAENRFFGKPCGLMDQMASAVGGMVAMDFREETAPVITPIAFDFAACGHALCILDSGASHADLTEEYAAIPREMGAVSGWFGKVVLAEVPQEAFYEAIPQLRQHCGDRAVLRALHFYQENDRVPRQAAALERGDFAAFLELVRQSGYSSYMYLQNVIPPASIQRQEMAVTLALCDSLLQGRGACRVHGGGFAGTVQAFVPFDLLDSFRTGVEAVLGQGACHVLTVRPQGGVEAFPQRI